MRPDKPSGFGSPGRIEVLAIPFCLILLLPSLPTGSGFRADPASSASWHGENGRISSLVQAGSHVGGSGSSRTGFLLTHLDGLATSSSKECNSSPFNLTRCDSPSSQGGATMQASIDRWRSLLIPSISGESLGYDPEDGRLILFGGVYPHQFSSCTTSNSTWEYDGQNWTQMHLSTSPVGRIGGNLIYFPPDQGLVLQGGYEPCGTSNADNGVNRTWLFSHNTWTPLAFGPPFRIRASVSYDPGSRSIVEFGGCCLVRPSGPNTTLSDTWVFNGSVWTNATPAFSPEGRQSAPLVTDSADGYVVLGPGWNIDRSRVVDSTWAFAGGIWRNLSAVSPVVPGDASCAEYLPAAVGVAFIDQSTAVNRMWLFKNGSWSLPASNTNGTPRCSAMPQEPSPWGALMLNGSTTLNFTPSGWQLQSPLNAPQIPCIQAGSPAEDCFPLLTFDPQIVGDLLLDQGRTWGYRNGTWTELQGYFKAVDCISGSLVYDTADSYPLLWGACGTPPYNSTTWRFGVSGGWAQVDVSEEPDASISWASMAYDAPDACVLLNAQGASSGKAVNQTWEFRAGTWSRVNSSTNPPVTSEGSSMSGQSLTYDPATNSTILYRTYDGCVTCDQLWSFSRGVWANISGVTSVTLNEGAQAPMVYFPDCNCLLLLATPSFWLLTNGSWGLYPGPPRELPPERTRGGMTYDPLVGAVLLVGGLGVLDAWEFGAVPPNPPLRFPVEFVAEGLNPGGVWGVQVSGQTIKTNGSSLSVSLPNGTYGYSVMPPAGFMAHPGTGSFIVSGQDTREVIQFSDAGYVAGSVEPRNASLTVDGVSVSLNMGNFNVSELPGVHNIVASSLGFASQSIEVTVTPIRTAWVSIALHPLSAPTSKRSTPLLAANSGWGFVLLATTVALLSIAGAIWLARRRPRDPSPIRHTSLAGQLGMQ